MDEIKRIDRVQDYNEYIGVDTLHPLVSVIKFNEIPAVISYKMYLGIYAVFLKNIKCGNITYGCQPYDYEDGTLVFVSPGQVYGIDSKGVNGWVFSRPTEPCVALRMWAMTLRERIG